MQQKHPVEHSSYGLSQLIYLWEWLHTVAACEFRGSWIFILLLLISGAF